MLGRYLHMYLTFRPQKQNFEQNMGQSKCGVLDKFSQRGDIVGETVKISTLRMKFYVLFNTI
jgi:hypothetical protein